ncbi:MAG TPA: HD-GYP domain-containing protein [Clostridiaceae bacterium]|nr:HD-GYP domain-containing protein [Clostridiaceae bacterium]
MRKISLERARAGLYVARTIHSLDGIVLLYAGSKLTEENIQHLKSYNITEIYIEDELSKGIVVTDVVREDIVLDVKAKIKTIMTTPSLKISVDGKKIMELVEKLLDNILNSDFIIANLSDIRSIDDYTYSHSVNVCILSLITGIALGIKGENLKDLGVGALLHDIGKIMIDEKILQKPTNLTINEFDEVKKHTVYGYEILKNSNDVNSTAHIIALSHHERKDGSGYPYNLKNNDIPLPARIVAIADVYDALTTNRIYRKKMLPHEVVDYMCSLSNKHFDKTCLDAFISHIANYPVGTAVMLNSGEKGLVAKYNKNFPNRPVVRVVIDENGKMLVKPKEIDLFRKPEYRIVDIWDI